MKLQFQKFLLGEIQTDNFIVSVYQLGANFHLRLPGRFVNLNEMEDKVIEFLEVPSKKILGFRVLKNFKPGEIDSKAVRHVKLNHHNNIAQIGITRFLNKLNYQQKDKTVRYKIENHDDTMYGQLFYMDLTKPYGQKSTAGEN